MGGVWVVALVNGSASVNDARMRVEAIMLRIGQRRVVKKGVEALKGFLL
jgi:hypothetical protein